MACGSCYKVDFSHIKRQGNSPARLLAKYALGIVDYETWVEASPCFLEQALIHDVSFLVWSLIKVQYSHQKKKKKCIDVIMVLIPNSNNSHTNYINSCRVKSLLAWAF